MPRSRVLAWAAVVASTPLLAIGCVGGSDDGSQAAVPPSVRGVCTSFGIHYLGKAVRGRAAVCFTLTRDAKAVQEIGIGVSVTADQCGFGHEDHWHWDLSEADPRPLEPGGRIEVKIAVPTASGYRTHTVLIRGLIRGSTASGVIRESRSCYPPFKWTAHRVRPAE